MIGKASGQRVVQITVVIEANQRVDCTFAFTVQCTAQVMTDLCIVSVAPVASLTLFRTVPDVVTATAAHHVFFALVAPRAVISNLVSG